MPKPVSIMGATYQVSGKDELLTAIDSASSMAPVRIATLNPEFMLEAETNSNFRRALTNMSNCTLDGFGLFLMLRLSRQATPERYAGADLSQDLFQKYQDGTRRFFLLGGLGNEAKLAADALHLRYPQLDVVGSESGGAIETGALPDCALISRISDSKADILLVGFGAPKQELWISKSDLVSVPVMIGVGGSFGFLGQKKRAPSLFRRFGLEWLYRGLYETGHWRRVFRAVIVFPLHYIVANFKHG